MDLPTLIRVLLVLIAVYGIGGTLKNYLKATATFSKDIPVVGVRRQFLSIARASLRQLTNGATTLLDGYRQASNISLLSH